MSGSGGLAGLRMNSEVMIWVAVVLFGFGTIIGSFLTVVITRVPAGESIIRPRSTCPRCDRQLSWSENIPIVSWLVQRGRCRGCGSSISIRYPLVELGTASSFAVMGLLGWIDAFPLALLPAFLVITAAGIALVVIDLEHHRLPNPIVASTYALSVPLAIAGLVVTGDWSPLIGALIGALLWGAVFGGTWVLTRGRGMGLGDVKLAPLLGASLGLLGPLEAAVGLLATFVIGAVVGLGLLAARRVKRRQAIPFGPFMVAGWFATVVVGSATVEWYLTSVLGRYPS
jgi:leader peptidase (prepilin peptidase)/N-methyltransferase